MATAVYMETQGYLVEWFKNEGDEVTPGDVLAEVGTGKYDTIEVYARESGVLRKRLVETGGEGGAQTVIAIIGAPGEDISALIGNGAAAAAPPPQPVEPVAAGGDAAAAGNTADAGRAEAARVEDVAPPPPAAEAPAPAPAAEPPAAAQAVRQEDGRTAAPPPSPVHPLPREAGMQVGGARGAPHESFAARAAGGERSEIVEGRAVPLGASSLVHNLIVSNLVGTLFAALRGTGFRVVSQGMAVKPARGENVFLPDLAVFGEAAEFENGAVEMLLNPVVLVEVLSPGTTDHDHGKKWESYRRVSSLRDYLMVWHDQARVEWYSRQGAFWRFGEVEGLQEEMQLESIGAALRLAEVYDGVFTADGASA